MDYRKRKYLRPIRDSRLGANAKSVVEGFSELETVPNNEAVEELEKIQIFPQTARKQIWFKIGFV